MMVVFKIQTINSDNESESGLDNIHYQMKMMAVTMKHFMRSQKKIQTMRKRESNMILMCGLKNKWIFTRIDQKSPLVAVQWMMKMR